MQSIIKWQEVNLRKKDPGLPTEKGICCLVRWKDGKKIRTETATWEGKYFVRRNTYMRAGEDYICPKTGVLWCPVDSLSVF